MLLGYIMPVMNPLSLATATPPQTDLKNGLRSTAFDDVYFNTESNLADASYVFLEGNDLIERWQKQATDELFVVAETGFGSGLNLLLLLRLKLEDPPSCFVLNQLARLIASLSEPVQKGNGN